MIRSHDDRAAVTYLSQLVRRLQQQQVRGFIFGMLTAETGERQSQYHVDFGIIGDPLCCPGTGQHMDVSIGKGGAQRMDGGRRQQQITQMVGSNQQDSVVGAFTGRTDGYLSEEIKQDTPDIVLQRNLVKRFRHAPVALDECFSIQDRFPRKLPTSEESGLTSHSAL